MSRRSDRKTDVVAAVIDRRRRWLRWPALALLLLAVASNAYLAYLYVEVRGVSAPSVASFCAISEQLNCVTVAASRYAAFLGIPVAVYGLEYFGLCTLVVLFSLAGVWRLRAWDSLTFWMMLLALPVSALMAYIATVRIGSFCLLCSVVYGVNLLLLLLLGLAHRRRLAAFMREGPRELLKQLSSNLTQATLTAIVIVGLSQFFWIPDLFVGQARAHRLADGEEAWAGIPTTGVTAGPATASIKIEVFSDFQCPFCARMHEVMTDLMRRWGKRVQLRHRDYPLDQDCNRTIKRPFHANACTAARYARCAAEQDKFWQLQALLYDNQHHLDRDEIERYAAQIGLDPGRLRACAQEARTRQAVLEDIEEGIRRGVRGTPTFFLNGREISDRRMGSVAFWEAKVRQALSR